MLTLALCHFVRSHNWKMDAQLFPFLGGCGHGFQDISTVMNASIGTHDTWNTCWTSKSAKMPKWQILIRALRMEYITYYIITASQNQNQNRFSETIRRILCHTWDTVTYFPKLWCPWVRTRKSYTENTPQKAVNLLRFQLHEMHDYDGDPHLVQVVLREVHGHWGLWIWRRIIQLWREGCRQNNAIWWLMLSVFELASERGGWCRFKNVKSAAYLLMYSLPLRVSWELIEFQKQESRLASV